MQIIIIGSFIHVMRIDIINNHIIFFFGEGVICIATANKVYYVCVYTNPAY